MRVPALLATAIALALGATGAAPSMSGRGGIVWVRDRAPWPVLTCSPGYLCEMDLPPTEEMTRHPLAGDLASWTIQALPGYGGKIFFQPDRPGLRTDLIAFTSAHTYHFVIESVKDSQYVAYSVMFRPTPPPAPPRIVVVAPTPVPTIPPLRGKYRIEGAAGLRPAAVGNDGIRTYVELPEMPEYPALVAVDPHGAPMVVNYAVHVLPAGRLYIVAGVQHELRLVLGYGKGQQVVTITEGV